jgi:hypothetical protein
MKLNQNLRQVKIGEVFCWEEVWVHYGQVLVKTKSITIRTSLKYLIRSVMMKKSFSSKFGCSNKSLIKLLKRMI